MLIARRASICSSCRGRIAKGDLIRVSPETGALHAGCPDPAFRVNSRPGPCRACGARVAAREGALQPVESGTRLFCRGCLPR